MGKPTSWVYFVQAGENGPIKIGVTSGDPMVRMAALQTGNPERLRMLGYVPGDRSREERAHSRFSDLRMQGEWFRAAPELLTFIDGAVFASGHVTSSEVEPGENDEDELAAEYAHIWSVCNAGNIAVAEWSDFGSIMDPELGAAKRERGKSDVVTADQLSFILGLIDGRIAVRDTGTVGQAVGTDPSKVPARKMPGLLLAACRYAQAVYAVANDPTRAFDDFVGGVREAISYNEPEERFALINAAIAAHDTATDTSGTGLMSREHVALVCEFGRIQDAVVLAAGIEQGLRGREALDPEELVRVGDARAALLSFLAANSQAARLFGVAAIQKAVDALTEIESVHGYAVAYPRLVEDGNYGADPCSALVDQVEAERDRDWGPLSDGPANDGGLH